jgi:hypothetical protein
VAALLRGYADTNRFNRDTGILAVERVTGTDALPGLPEPPGLPGGR